MTSVHSINFPQARLMAGGYFGLIQASRNTLQRKQRQLTIKHMILPKVALTFSQQKWEREKPTPSLGNESYVSGGSKKESELGNSRPCFTGQEYVLVKLLQDQYEPSLYSLEIMQGLDICCFWSHHAKGVVLRVTQRGCLQREWEWSLR